MRKIELLRSQFNTNLVKAFKSVEPFSEAHVNIALSVSKEGLPARFLAGIIPAFSLAEAIREQFGAAASVRVFAPINLAVACNGFNGESHTDITREQAQEQFRAIGTTVIDQGRILVQKLQQAQFPSISWKLTLDQPWNKNAEELLETIWKRSFELDEEQLSQARDTVVQTGKLNAHLYIPHHLFGWQDCFSPFIFPIEDKPQDGELVINCMSQSERNFQAFRRRLAWDLQVTRPNLLVSRSPVDVMTERCPGPHYIRSQDGERIEPSLEDLLSEGFVSTVRSLSRFAQVNPKFETARKDMLSVSEFFHQRWVEDSNRPTFDEFIGTI